MTTPKITVLMAVYNSQKYLREAIDSVLAQTFTDFEFLIIDDGSQDDTVNIIKSYNDPRIIIFTNPQNIGLTKSLNVGLKAARGTYIARLDGDDISLPTRLEEQYNHLEANPSVALVGSWAECIDKDGKTIKISRNPSDPILIKFELLFENRFIHSSIFFRRDVVLALGGYNEDYRHSQDFELYSRLIQKYPIYNLPKVLTKLRLHDESVVAKAPTQKIVYTNALRIIRNNVEQYTKVSDKEFDILVHALILKKPWKEGTFSKIRTANNFLKKIYLAYLEKEKLSKSDEKKVYAIYKARKNMLFKHYLINLYRCFIK